MTFRLEGLLISSTVRSLCHTIHREQGELLSSLSNPLPDSFLSRGQPRRSEGRSRFLTKTSCCTRVEGRAEQEMLET